MLYAKVEVMAACISRYKTERDPRQLCLLSCPGNGQSSIFQLCGEMQMDLLSFSVGKR